MLAILTKLSDARHRMTVRRSTGPEESVELESRSYLLHDLAHYAVETETLVQDGFYGLLASGVTLALLNDRTAPLTHAGLIMAETLAAPLQSLHHGRLSRQLYLEHGIRAYPAIVNDVFVDRVLERLRRLEGHYRATRYGSTMELSWPPAAGPDQG